ncbi:MAG: DUF4388 domain-containing protein [Thermoleophilia bacterium]|jgi:hypothetical protein|nr:DUF4388 domain-containing protein [Thermoleophilia bacterium]
MRGTLESFSIVELLQMLGTARHTGTLHLECPGRLIDVRFATGRIGEARDSTRVATDTVLGSLLLRRALINETQLDAALREQERHPRPVGTILVDHGALHERDLREVLARQLANTLVAARTELSGAFVFAADPDPKPVDYLTIDTQAVLIDISSVAGDYCLAVEVLGQADTVVFTNTDYETLPAGSMTMGRDEFMILALADGHRTVREITAASGLEELTVVSVLGKLCDAGVLLVQAERPTRAEADEELRAHRDSVWAEVNALFDLATPEDEEAARAAAVVQAAAAAGATATESAGRAAAAESAGVAPESGAATASEGADPAPETTPVAPASAASAAVEPTAPEPASDDEIDWDVLTPD